MELMKYEGEWYVWTLVITTILFVLIMPKKNLTWVGIFITILFLIYITLESNSSIPSSYLYTSSSSSLKYQLL